MRDKAAAKEAALAAENGKGGEGFEQTLSAQRPWTAMSRRGQQGLRDGGEYHTTQVCVCGWGWGWGWEWQEIENMNTHLLYEPAQNRKSNLHDASM